MQKEQSREENWVELTDRTGRNTSSRTGRHGDSYRKRDEDKEDLKTWFSPKISSTS